MASSSSVQSVKFVDSPRVKTLLKPLASLRLTVLLLALSMVLVFVGTSAQKDAGIWDVQHRFFHAFVSTVPLRYFFPLSEWAWSHVRGAIVIPGGYTLIILLLVNLIAAHAIRFKVNAKRTGILLIHAGMILLLLGEVVTSLFAVESQMTIDVGQTVSWTQDIRSAELAVIDQTPADHDDVVTVADSRLAKQDTISYPTLPFSLRVEKYIPNSSLLGPFQAKGLKPEATAGVAAGWGAVDEPKVKGTNADELDFPAAYVSVVSGGQTAGTFLLTTMPLQPQFPQVQAPQPFTVGGRTYALQLRFKRHYKPYAVTLLDFTHARYTGTDVPKDFSSHIHLVDPTRGENREVRIWMNHPLRYAGETFYQASFRPGDKTTILQVVRNPGWLMPYFSCAIVALGMVVHFGAALLNFLRRKTVPLARPTTASGRRPVTQIAGLGASPICAALAHSLPLIAGALVLVYLLSLARPPKQTGPLDTAAFARVPISYEGRVMPLDSLARNSLRIISGNRCGSSQRSRHVGASASLAPASRP